MIDENEGLDPDSNPVESEDEEITDSELNGIESTPSQGDPTKYCQVSSCDWDKGKGSRSMKGHIRGMIREGDEDHIAEKDGAYALIDDWREAHPTKKEPARKPTARRAPSGSTSVTIKGVTAEFDPVQAQMIKELKAETEILKERLVQKSVRGKLGDPEVEEQQQRAFYEEEQRKEDALMAKDKQIERLYKQIDEDRQRAHEKEIIQIKSSHKTDLRFQDLDHKLDLKLAERDDRRFGSRDEEVNRALVKGIDALTDSFTVSSRHNMGELRKLQHASQTYQTGTPPEDQPDVELVPSGDRGILSKLPARLIQDD